MERQIKQLVSEFLVYLGIDFTDLEIEKKDDKNIKVNIVSEDPSLLIGHHGENLNAMQKILKVVFHKLFGEDTMVSFDIDNYRSRQEENVLTIAGQKVQEVRATHKEATLPPMSPYFRRLVHMFLKEGEYSDLKSESIGQGNYRQVVIKPNS